jgi:hypothetical protein
MNKKLYALGRLKTGQMNKTESTYAQHLELQKRAGEILWFAFEGLKLRLADNTFYTPDFFVMRSNGEIEAHEVKGYMLDDANVKIKTASELFPFRFIVVRILPKNKGGGFIFKEI